MLTQEEKYQTSSVEELQKEIKLLDLRQNAIKILINAAYGAFGNKYFYWANIDIAQSITLQGQDLIKFSVKALNHFFRNKWHLDTELHRKLGISQYTISQIESDTVIYVDTDSNYVWFYPALASIQGMPEMDDSQALKFILKIDEYGIKPYLKSAFEKYAEHFNTQNRQDFELENISVEAVWLKKKNYLLNIGYEDNEHQSILPEEKRYKIIKGLENVKGSYPIWARTKLGEIDNVLLKKGRNLNVDTDLIPMLRTIKEEYLNLDIDAIAFNFNLNEYDKYIIDLEKLEFAKGTGPIPRGSAYYNFTLLANKDENHKPAQPGNKVKLYHCGQENNPHNFDIFCYPPGDFPELIAPAIDRDEQFFRLIIEPCNRFLSAYGWIELTSKLTRVVEIIKSRSKKPVKPEDFYPYHVIDQISLESMEVPEKFNRYLEDHSLPVDPEEFGEYLSCISKYELNTKIVSSSELQKYIKRQKKKLEKKAKGEEVTAEDTQEEAAPEETTEE